MKTMGKMILTIFAATTLTGTGCIIDYEENHPHPHSPPHHDPDPDPDPDPTPPVYTANYVEVSCYATGASASSNSIPESIDFDAVQATGSPDTQNWNNPYCVDSPFAWSPQYENAGAEWLDVVYDVEMLVDRVRIFENHGAGATDYVTLVNTQYPDTPETAVAVPYSLQGSNQPCSVMSLDIDDPVTGDEWTELLYDGLMIDLDTTLSFGWNEIDAVEMIGLWDENSGTLPLSCDYL